MTRLPKPGGDDNQWGDILNGFLSVELNQDGSLKKTAQIQSAMDTATTANTTAQSAVQSVNGKTGQAVSLKLTDLSDMALTGLVDGQTIARSGTTWVPTTPVSGGTNRGAWAATTAYKVNDLVTYQSQTYSAVDTHTSGSTFTGDQAAHWVLLAGSGSPKGAIADYNASLHTTRSNLSTGFTSRSTGGPGGILVLPAGDSDSLIDWRAAGNGYVFHLGHVTNSDGTPVTGQGTNFLFGIGVQGDGGGGILLAHDGPKGIPLFIDQKGVVQTANSPGLRIDQRSRFSEGIYLQSSRPEASTLLRVLSTGHTPRDAQYHAQFSASHLRANIMGVVEAERGSLRWYREMVVDGLWNTTNNDDARLGYIGFNGRAYLEDRHGLGQAGSTSGDGVVLRMHANAGGTQKQFYSGALRMSKVGQSLRLQVHSGAIGLGYENLQTVFDATSARVQVIGAGFRVDPLAVPAAPTLAVVGTAGATTYSYRVAAVNANGTTLASTAATIVGPDVLSGANLVRVTIPTVVGATSFKIYGRTSGSELLMFTVTSPTRSVADGIMKAAQAGRTVTDAVTTASSATITSATAAFTSDDMGSTILIPGGGYNGNTLDTNITAFNSATSVTVETAPSVTLAAGSMTISRTASRMLTSATAVFARGDVGRRITVAGAGSAAGILYTNIVSFISATQVLVEDIPITSVLAAAVTIDGGPIPTTWDDDGTVTPAGALPSNPAGTSSIVQAWDGQTGDLWKAQDSSASAHIRVTAPTTSKAASLVVGKAALALSATDGFLYLPTVAGTPTGVPTTQAGTSAAVYDTTANKLWIYNGGWKSATFA